MEARGRSDPMRRVWDGTHPTGKAALMLGGVWGGYNSGPLVLPPQQAYLAALFPQDSPLPAPEGHTQFLAGKMPAWRTAGSWGVERQPQGT